MDKVNCGDCHSPSDDYLGNIEGNQPDVHWTQAKMTCMDCHSEATVHGVEPGGSNANAAPATRSCESCHPEAVSGHSDIRQHDLHYDKVACWVCHAQSYQNCYDCHVQRKDTGELSRKPGRVEMGFKIGRLPGTNAQGQPLYGLVNHVPVTRDSYAILGDNLLPHFDDVPTWKPTTPHNILRRTKQNARCEACHESGDLWLQSSDLEPGDAKANLSVVVEPPHPRDKYQEP
jgi:thiosulfate/3-mercaptopyruvate sulfurtransferase